MSRVIKVKEQMHADSEEGKYSVDLRTEEDRLKYYKEVVEEHNLEKRNLARSWDLFVENVLEDDFKWSRRSGIAMVLFPTLTNAYFIWGAPGHYLKNPVRIAALVAGIATFNYNLNKDFEELAKKDTPLANKFRSYAQNIAKVNLNYPDFAEDTVRIASMCFI